MNKQKVILRIKSFSVKDGEMLLSITDYGIRSMIKGLVDLCHVKHGDYISCEFAPPYKKRTTGKDSQNSHIWGHIQQIANETGNEVTDIEDYIKMKAMKRGYPYHICKLTGEMKPNSMKGINTVEAGYLIDELHLLASELEITLVEN